MATAILAVQGAFAEHARALGRLGEETVLLRNSNDLGKRFDRLVLPGGESTVQAKLISEQGMRGSLRELICAGMPVLATCAGTILLAEHLEGDDPPERLGTLPVCVARNAYGRQIASFRTMVEFTDLGRVPATFIRAPQIVSVGEGCDVLARADGLPVAVRFGNQLACTFHPELDSDDGIHGLFLAM